MDPNQISKFVCHQVGSKGFKLHAEYAKVPIKIMPDTVSTLGNIVTATIPVNLHKLMTEKMVSNGDKIFLSGVGSGIAFPKLASFGMRHKSCLFCICQNLGG